MKILITGVKGFAGSQLVDMLTNETHDYDIYGTYRPTDQISLLGVKQEVKLLQCDMSNFRSVKRVVELVSPELIIHFAGYVSVANSIKYPRLTFRSNVIGTINLLEAVKKTNIGANILIPGSAEVYGNVAPTKMPIKETQALEPNNPYGMSKAAQEMLGLYYFKTFGLNVYLTRTFHYAGPAQPPRFVCSAFAKQVASIEKNKQRHVIRMGNPKAKRDFLDIRDVVRAYWKIIEEGSPGTIYNVCRGVSISVEEILKMLLEMSSGNIVVKVDEKKLRPVEIADLVGDNSKLKRATSWTPQIGIEETLSDLLNFWRSRLDDDS